MISLVTAKVIRANEQYNYKLKGKGEKYLVNHNEGESASDIIVDYLTPYAVEGSVVSIESVMVQKSTEILDSKDEDCPIYKCSIRLEELLEDGKTRKVQRKIFVQASNPAEAIALVENEMTGLYEYEVLSVTKTNIIEIK